MNNEVPLKYFRDENTEKRKMKLNVDNKCRLSAYMLFLPKSTFDV